jgi:hypothetical protein
MTPAPDSHVPERDDRETPTVERTGVLADDPAAPPVTAEQRWHALARLMSVESRCLAPLVRMSPLPDGVALTHRVPLDSVTLASLRAASPLRAGHVLTVALALAEALADLDEHGLAHGGVTGDQVVVAPDGSVVLAGCGLAWRRAPGDVDGPRTLDDVAALGELVRDLLGSGSSPSSLVLAALRAADPDPALRPTPLELTAMLRRCGRADPLLDLIWGGSARRARAAVVVEPSAAPRLRIDPRTALEPDHEVAAPDRLVERGEQAVRAEATPRPRTAPPRRAGAPRRPAARERRRPRRRGGPWVILLVSVLAALALGAVRVGARAMADGPAGEGSAGGAVAVPATSTSDLPTDAAAGTATVVPSQPPATTPGEAAASTTGSDVAAGGSVVDLDRGAVSTAPDWVAVLAAADAGRQRALVAGDATALATWVDPEGSAWTADAALAARVTALGARIEGGALVVLDVRPRHVTASQAVLLVQDRREPYSVTTATGTSNVAARAPRWWQVTLRRTTESDGAVVWRVHDVAPAAAPKG